MSPEQLKALQKLNRLFEEGAAGPKQIKKLSALLAEINQQVSFPEDGVIENLSSPKITY